MEDLPLFLATDGNYHKADDIFCLDQDEQISEPEKVCRMMGFKGFLFTSSSPVKKLHLKTEHNIKDRLFERALSVPMATAEILEYLDSAGYTYSEKQLEQESLDLTGEQIEIIFKHKNLASLMKSLGRNYVNNKSKRLRFGADKSLELNIQSELHKYLEDFDLNETPEQIEKYMRFCHEKCICLDIDEEDYLPCYNAIILSRKNTLNSFAAFCHDIDQRDTFAIRIKLRNASKRLDEIEQGEGSASDYLRNLRKVRLLIKESLGHNGYKNYLDLILKSGVDKERFIQELIQNADDCEYPQGSLPAFSLKLTGDKVLTAEYNEVGFSRANIRAITAIGESTKNKLFKGQYDAIGEKGVGFKTIFSVASKVIIRSGEFSFFLTDKEPTIPRQIKPSEQEPTSGTRMEISLKDPNSFPSYKEKEVLELCLCLCKLRYIKIGDHTISIEDNGEERKIIIDKRQHIFRRFTHAFTITDEMALEERKNGMRETLPEQVITCFVPEKGGSSNYALYNGLPTKHRMNIPMAIDAPFALTTSREEIETGNSAWNNIIRKELYSAIMAVIDAQKTEEREKVFRFAKFIPRRHGSTTIYDNDISDCKYLSSYDFLSDLMESKILPTFDHDVFGVPSEKAAFRYPEAANIIFRTVPQDEYAGIRPSSVIDVKSQDFEAVLNALECKAAPFECAFRVIAKHAEQFIRQEEFRSKAYEFLQDISSSQNISSTLTEQLKQLAIIPVYGKTAGSVEYIRWADDSIFVKKNANTSAEDYFVLDENLLPKTCCERMFDANINEMTFEWEQKRYNDHLKEIIQGSDIEAIYRFLMNEFHSGTLQRNDSFSILAFYEDLPLKNELGDIVKTPLFLCNQPAGYFPVKMIQKLIVHKECHDFATFMPCGELSDIHYDDIDYYEELTADDVETLLDDYFINSEEILRGFYRDRPLSDKLLNDYDLGYLAFGLIYDYEEFEFPSAPVKDRNRLKEYVRRQWEDPVKVISVKVERNVQKGQTKDGSIFELETDDARSEALNIYTPEGGHNIKICFCQMCRKAKPYKFIEVNNIEKSPEYFFPQLRIALCLECSKIFESLRINGAIREKYLASIREAEILD